LSSFFFGQQKLLLRQQLFGTMKNVGGKITQQRLNFGKAFLHI
jgi:hypothetical protein